VVPIFDIKQWVMDEKPSVRLKPSEFWREKEEVTKSRAQPRTRRYRPCVTTSTDSNKTNGQARITIRNSSNSPAGPPKPMIPTPPAKIFMIV